MAVRVPVVPATLAWARQALHVSLDDLARAAGTKPAQVAAWEAGDQQPTMNQLRSTAKRLDRTVAFFFLPPPEQVDIPRAPDFRGRDEDAEQSPGVLRELKRAEGRRQNYLDVVGLQDAPFALPEFTWSTIPQRTAELRRALAPLLPEATHTPGLNDWIAALESFGVLVFQSSGVALAEFRAVSVFHERLPFVVLNGADSQTARIFSLFHEVGHLANRTGGVCLTLETTEQEILCNRFSAEFLMPRDRVLSVVRRSQPGDLVGDVERHFGVSSLAAAVRLRALDLISDDALEAVRRASDARWAEERRRQADREGFAPQWQLAYRNLGQKYMRGVLHALEDSRIDRLDASYLLDARVPMVEKLLSEMDRRGEL
ncbi:ImmA/IrrE family metallo-endopeptidase [Cellulomonas sp. APG4]|uniref:helix-turn-helix domain-containing protein n=1 Tax=Cellulomonas sp. APG4 TaxID=1538656 RepID=UPI001379E113|nr:XRE family transcriptional regulator [Cellulomonas sp. APG4]NCT90138.1 ImmA/IrrE family metallo-endopeptidase [Cellulomonas sp. APG4]